MLRSSTVIVILLLISSSQACVPMKAPSDAGIPAGMSAATTPPPPPTCPYKCDPTPFAAPFPGAVLTPAILSSDCEYTCGPGKVLVRPDSFSTESFSAIPDAFCSEDGQFNSTEYMNKAVPNIACAECDVPDGPYAEAGGSPQPTVNSCIMACDNGDYILSYSVPKGTTPYAVLYVSRNFHAPPLGNFWTRYAESRVPDGSGLSCFLKANG